MFKGIVMVAHHVSTDPVYCEFDGPDDGFCERSVCRYLRKEFKTQGRGRSAIKLPRCSLFKAWLEKEGFSTLKCDRCKEACAEQDG